MDRADVVLYKLGFFDSREKAKSAIMEGAVYIDEKRIDKPGDKIDETSNINIRKNLNPYVSRGGLKLEKAINVFNLNLDNAVAVDIGSSTGGFTDCMLQNGARKVFAIDVGYGQLDWKLRNDDRVIVKERTNIRNVDVKDLGERVDFISIDVSFISLKLVLPIAYNLLKENGTVVALVKPQFEAGKDKVGKKGIIRSSKTHMDVLHNIKLIAEDLNFVIEDIDYSPITGTKGNIEFIACLRKDNNVTQINDEDIKNIVKKAHEDL